MKLLALLLFTTMPAWCDGRLSLLLRPDGEGLLEGSRDLLGLPLSAPQQAPGVRVELGEHATVSFRSLAELGRYLAQHAGYSPFYLKRVKPDQYRLHFAKRPLLRPSAVRYQLKLPEKPSDTVPGQVLQPPIDRLLTADPTRDYQLDATIPGPILDTNAHRIDDTSVQWCGNNGAAFLDQLAWQQALPAEQKRSLADPVNRDHLQQIWQTRFREFGGMHPPFAGTFVAFRWPAGSRHVETEWPPVPHRAEVEVIDVLAPPAPKQLPDQSYGRVTLKDSSCHLTRSHPWAEISTRWHFRFVLPPHPTQRIVQARLLSPVGRLRHDSQSPTRLIGSADLGSLPDAHLRPDLHGTFTAILPRSRLTGKRIPRTGTYLLNWEQDGPALRRLALRQRSCLVYMHPRLVDYVPRHHIQKTYPVWFFAQHERRGIPRGHWVLVEDASDADPAITAHPGLPQEPISALYWHGPAKTPPVLPLYKTLGETTVTFSVPRQ